MTLRELDYKLKAYKEKTDDYWDYTRHIMAAMGVGKGDPRKAIPLDRDEANEKRRRKEMEKQVDDARNFLRTIKKPK